MATQFTHPAEALDTIDTSRFECIDGQLVERPLPNITHSRAVKRLTVALDGPASELGMDSGPELSVDRTPGSRSDWMTPDFAVSMPGGYKANHNGHALPPVFLVVEVLSPGQTITNMGDKLKRYLEWGALHVWLIDPDKRQGMTEAAEVITETGSLEAGTELTVLLREVLS